MAKHSQAMVAQAARELLRRDLAAESLTNFVQSVDVPGAPVGSDNDSWIFGKVESPIARHHVFMLDILEKVMTHKLPRAMIFLPPGSAKSTMGSVVAPVWAMGKFPGTKIILASYGSDLARKHGRKARQLAKTVEFGSIFETSISPDTAAADEWALTNGSEYLACGILSGITGNRAMGIILDDVVKGRQEADSESVRNRTWDVYQEDLRTRLIPGGWEILIATRWSEDDMAGRLLPDNYDSETGLIKCRDGREWYVVCIPAQCEREDDPIGRKVGEYLWPEWFKNDHFLPFKQIPRTWNALFQQRPSPETGTYFQRDWFKRYSPKEKPEMLHIYGSSDYAVSANTGDFTEHGVIGVDQDGDLWILDWWHGQKEADVWIDAQLDLMQLWEPFAWFGESGVIRKAISPFLNRRQMERKVYGRIEWIPSVVNKVIKARGFQGRAAMGKVHLPVGEIGDRVLDELLRFPTGRHDDVPDVLSLFCLALDQAHPAIVREAREAKYKTRAERHLDDAIRPFNEESTFGKWDTPDIPGVGGQMYYDTL